MRSIIPMRAAKTGYLILSGLLCALGIFLIVQPDFSIRLAGLICGILLLAFGVVKLVGFFSKDLYRLAFQYDLAFGLLLIPLGIMLLTRPESLMTFLCAILGLITLADGAFRIQMALEAKQFGISNWWLIFALAIAAGVLGGVLMFRPSESGCTLMVLLGFSLLAEGLLNLSAVLTAVKIIRHQQPDVIEDVSYQVKEE